MDDISRFRINSELFHIFLFFLQLIRKLTLLFLANTSTSHNICTTNNTTNITSKLIFYFINGLLMRIFRNQITAIGNNFITNKVFHITTIIKQVNLLGKNLQNLDLNVLGKNLQQMKVHHITTMK